MPNGGPSPCKSEAYCFAASKLERHKLCAQGTLLDFGNHRNTVFLPLTGMRKLNLERASDAPCGATGRGMRITNIPAIIPHQLLRRLGMVFILTFAAGEQPSLIRGQWQPPGALSSGHYVGSKVCASCHVTESAVQPDTPMAQTLSPIANSQVLQSHPHLSGQLGRYSYQIVTESGKPTYIVSDGINSTTETLLWAVGQGRGGQSYLYNRNGRFYEARVSYFSEIGNLDLTLGHPHAEPA